MALMRATATQLSPIFGLHPDDNGAATAILQRVTASRQPDATADHNQFLAWKQKRQELIDRLGAGPQALGSALLERVTDERLAELSIPQAKGFLAVMARSHPEAATPRLLELFRTYGHPLDLRQGAARELAVADPRLAIEEYGPLLEMPRPGSTMPGHEFLLEAYLIACENQQEDPTEVLVAITTGILYDSTVRHAAVRALGERPSEMGFHALEQALIESTGNVYLRKLAAQSLIASNPEQACEVLRRVADAEADIGFLEALANLLETHCE